MSERPKRHRQPPDSFSPDKYQSRKRRNNARETKRSRMLQRMTNTDSNVNKWGKYRQSMHRLVNSLMREAHFLEVLTQERQSSVGGDPVDHSQNPDVIKATQKVIDCQKAIRNLLLVIANENAGDKVWEELGQPDENGDVDVNEILCSRCLRSDGEDDDVLLCDKAGCFRVYHRYCLDPPVPEVSDDPSLDWFCQRCHCLDDCMDYLGESWGEDFDNPEDVFKEVETAETDLRQLVSSLHGHLNDLDSDSDEEYQSKKQRKRLKGNKKELIDYKSDSEDNDDVASGAASNDEMKEAARVLSSSDDTGKGSSGEDSNSDNSDDSDSAGNSNGSSLPSDVEESDISDDELSGLLAEAEEGDASFQRPQLSDEDSDAEHAEEAAFSSHRLRARRDNKAVTIGQEDGGSVVSINELSSTLHGVRDIGRKIAKSIIDHKEIQSLAGSGNCGNSDNENERVVYGVVVDFILDASLDESLAIHLKATVPEATSTQLEMIEEAMPEEAESSPVDTLERESKQSPDIVSPVDLSEVNHELTNESVDHVGSQAGDDQVVQIRAKRGRPRNSAKKRCRVETIYDEQSLWLVRYDEVDSAGRLLEPDFAREEYLNSENMSDAVELYIDFEKEKARRLSKLPAAMQDIDQSNIVEHKRSRQNINYYDLNKEMFGESDDGDEDSDEDHVEKDFVYGEEEVDEGEDGEPEGEQLNGGDSAAIKSENSVRADPDPAVDLENIPPPHDSEES